MWESRERRKAKEYEKEFEREEMRKEEMVRELKPEATLGRVTEVLIGVWSSSFRRGRREIWQSSWRTMMMRKMTKDTISKAKTSQVPRRWSRY